MTRLKVINGGLSKNPGIVHKVNLTKEQKINELEKYLAKVRCIWHIGGSTEWRKMISLINRVHEDVINSMRKGGIA